VILILTEKVTYFDDELQVNPASTLNQMAITNNQILTTIRRLADKKSSK